jgi:TolB-like protein
MERNAWRAMTPIPTIAAANSPGIVLAGLFEKRESAPPVIHLTDWRDHQTIYIERFALCGSVRGSGKVVKLTINGEPVLPKAGAMVLFSHVVELKPGENPLTIMAEDESGRRTIKKLRIQRDIPRTRLLSERLRLTVFAFERKGEISQSSIAFQDNFLHQLAQQGRFQLIEREQLEDILQEHKISRSRLINQATAVRMGRLAAAQAIVAGSMVETYAGIEVVARVIDSETSEILTITDSYVQGREHGGIKALAETLALKIHHQFPLVEGVVLDKRKSIIFTDLGSKKVRAQRHLIVFQEAPVSHPRTGAPLGRDCQIVGKARIEQADEKISKAELRPGFENKVQPLHKVITQ